MQKEHKPEKMYPVSYKRWKSMIYKNQESLIRLLAKEITQVFDKAEQMELEAVSLHIIYLRTSVCNSHPYYRIYLFDKSGYNGNTGCWCYWEMPELVNFIENAFPITGESYVVGYGQMEAEMEQKRLQSAETLYQAIGRMVGKLLIQALNMQTQSCCYPIYFGEYMKGQQLLMQGGEINA